MTQPLEPDALRPALEAVQHDLEQHLAEVCTSTKVTEESTAELMRLEDALTEAAKAAKQAVSIRRRLRTRRETRGKRPAESDAAGSPVGSREFADQGGTVWHVWEVRPGRAPGAQHRAGLITGAYEGGWLAFETWDGQQRKRLPDIPAGWAELSVEELRALVERAEDARPKRRTPPDSATGTSSGPPPS